MKVILTTAGAGVLLLFLAASTIVAQVPGVRDPVVVDQNVLGEDWSGIGAHHVVRRYATAKFIPSMVSRENRDVISLLMENGFADRDYLESYQWAGEFLALFPGDGANHRALYIKGYSAFQLDLPDNARDAFDAVIGEHPSSPYRGESLFWRAMISIEQGRNDEAEADLTSMMGDPSAAGSRENALLGWALSVEKRGELDRAERFLDSLLTEFPDGPLSAEARLRSASIALRKGETGRARTFLDGVVPGTPAQEEETLLLEGETAYRQGRHTDAAASFGRLLDENPEGPLAPPAELGLAWAYVKQGRYDDAMVHLDSLARRNDSVGIAALYQGGVLSLLRGNVFEALASFDTLTYRSPYDRYAEKAYFQMGMIQYRTRRFRDARRNFSFAARLFPESPLRPLSYRMLGESNMAVNDFSNAQHAFAQVRKLNGPADLVSVSMFKEGICLYHLGRFRSSQELFDSFLAEHPDGPDAPEAWLWRGEALYQDSRFDEAERCFTQARGRLEAGERRATAEYGIAWSLFEQKKFSSAAASFDRFSKEYGDDPRVGEADLRRADCYFFMGDYERSGAIYSALSEGGGGRYSEYAAFQVGMSYIQRGDAGRGIEHLRSFLGKFPESIYAEVVQFNVAWTYFSLEDYPQALREFDILRARFPESQLMPRVYFNTADAWYNLKQYDSSRVYYQRVLEEFPASPLVSDAMTGLQYTYQAEGKPAAALSEIDRFLEQSPQGGSREELLMRKGDILFGQGNYAEAILEYQSIIRLDPPRELRAKTLYQLGRAYELENNAEQAVSYYQDILNSLDDTEVAQNVRLLAGLSYVRLKRYRAAVSALEPFASKYPDSPLLSEVRYHLGVAQMNLPDKRAAGNTFREVITGHPGDIFADRGRLMLARMHIEAKEYRASIDTLDRIVAGRNDDLAAEALLMMGENYLLLKKNADALQAFRDVYEQYTEYPLLVERGRLGGGEAYERLRDNGQAVALYEMIVENPVDPAVAKDAEERLRRLRK